MTNPLALVTVAITNPNAPARPALSLWPAFMPLPAGVALSPDGPRAWSVDAFAARTLGSALDALDALAPVDDAKYGPHANPVHLRTETAVSKFPVPTSRLVSWSRSDDAIWQVARVLANGMVGCSRESMIGLLAAKMPGLEMGEVEEIVDAARARPWTPCYFADAHLAETAAREERNKLEKERHRTKKVEAEVLVQVSAAELGVLFVTLSANAPNESEEPILRWFCRNRERAIRLPSGDYLFAVNAGRYAKLKHPGVKVAGNAFLSIRPSDWKEALTKAQISKLGRAEAPREFAGYIERARAATLDRTPPVAREGAAGRHALQSFAAYFAEKLSTGQIVGYNVSRGIPEAAEVAIAGHLCPPGDAVDLVAAALASYYESNPSQPGRPSVGHPYGEGFAQCVAKILKGEGRWLSNGELATDPPTMLERARDFISELVKPAPTPKAAKPVKMMSTSTPAPRTPMRDLARRMAEETAARYAGELPQPEDFAIEGRDIE